MCLMHSEAKKTEPLNFGAEKDLLQGQARGTGDSYSKSPNSPIVFREKFLQAKFGARVKPNPASVPQHQVKSKRQTFG